MIRSLPMLILVYSFQAAAAEAPGQDEALQRSVAELRNAIGRWSVTTDFLSDDGSVARTAQSTYEFSWIVRDRVAAGRNEVPALGQASGILFYIREKKREIEMVSVGSDGYLWIMTGPLGGNQRMSQELETESGMTRLRFTSFSVTSDRFESRMEYTGDGGKTWKPGNHQVFRRVKA